MSNITSTALLLEVLNIADAGDEEFQEMLRRSLIQGQNAALFANDQQPTLHGDPIDLLEYPHDALILAAVLAVPFLFNAETAVSEGALLDLIDYWLDHDDCVFVGRWPYSKERMKQYYRGEHGKATSSH